MNAQPEVKRRARSAAMKLARRNNILTSAHTLLKASGFDQFSMETLAKETGLARASLYRYFKTREEVLLTLYQQLRNTWKDRLLKDLKPGISDDALVEAYFNASSKDPIQVQLRSRLESTIKHNVSKEVLAAELILSQDVLGQVIERLHTCTGLSQAKCHDLVISYGALLVGASQLDSTPSMERRMLSPAAKRTSQALSYGRLFHSNGMRILQGLRQEPDEHIK